MVTEHLKRIYSSVIIIWISSRLRQRPRIRTT